MGKNDKPKKRAPDPIPVVGVRGSATKISAPKTILAGGAGLVAVTAPAGRAESALDVFLKGKAKGGGLAAAVDQAELRLRQSLSTGSGKLALGALAGMVLFGKAIDRRMPEFPIRFGR